MRANSLTINNGNVINRYDGSFCDVNNGNVINRYDGLCCDVNNGNAINRYEDPCCDRWVPVTTAWCVLSLRIEKRPPI